MTTDSVDIRPVKGTASRLLRDDSLLRKVLSSEPDYLTPSDFLAKLGTWLVLLREETTTA